MQNFKFYGVIGRNGAAVMDSWYGVQSIQTYIYKSSNKGFQTFREAEDWTLMMLADRFPRHNIPLSLRVNQAVYTRNMKGGEWDGE